jgi:HEAT repeat protein
MFDRLGSLLVLLLCVPSAAQADAKGLVRQLGGTDSRVRYEAYRTLRSTKPPAALPLLAAALPRFPLHAQSLGVSVLHVYPRQKVEPIMRRFARGESSFLMVQAGVWLHQTGDRSAVEFVVRGLGMTVPPNELSMNLGRVSALRVPEVSAAVLRHVHAGVGDGALEQALRHLMVCGHEPAIPVVRRLLESTDRLRPAQRMVCAAFLVAMGEGGHASKLADAIRESNNISRLRSFLQHAPNIDREILAAILDFTAGKSGYVVADALRLLAQHDYTPAVRKMRELLDDDDALVSKAAFDALMRMDSGLDSKHLKKLLGSSKPQVSIAAADALRRLDDLAGLSRVIDLAGKRGPHRLDAVDALGKFRSREAVSPLIERLDDADRSVRDRADQGLTRILSGLFPYRNLDLASTGYRSTGPAAARKIAVAQIRHWWKLQGVDK